ncbi:MAG: ABC transporter permease [Gordonia sp. (in: high G+C Gram-positive bacteria)]
MSAVANEATIPPRPQRSESRTLRRAVDDLSTGLRARELWAQLGWQDIKQRYRRSVLGPLWISIATGITALAMGLLYSQLFHEDIKTFLPYVTLGFIFWGFIEGSMLDGAEVFTKNDGLIKQIPAPLSVHVYRLVWRQLIVFAHNIVIYVILLVIFPQPLTWTVVLILPAMALFVLNSVWVAMVFGILTTRFRDVEQLLTTVVRLVFFMTPIIWSAKSLHQVTGGESSRTRIVEINPMYHFLEITRGPLLGESVAFYHWVIVIGVTIAGWLVTLFVMRNFRARVAYWV